MSRILHCLDIRFTEGGEVVSRMCQSHFMPQGKSWYLFLLEVDRVIIINDMKQIEREGWTGLIRLRTGTGGKHL
jgi:hypothetical protein